MLMRRIDDLKCSNRELSSRELESSPIEKSGVIERQSTKYLGDLLRIK